MLKMWYVLKIMCILEWSTIKQLTTLSESLSLWLDRKSEEFIDLLGEGLLLWSKQPLPCRIDSCFIENTERNSNMKQELPVAWKQDSYRSATAGKRDFEKHFMMVQPGRDVDLGEKRRVLFRAEVTSSVEPSSCTVMFLDVKGSRDGHGQWTLLSHYHFSAHSLLEICSLW